MQNKLISIGKASELLGVSIDTLRRWDESGRLKSKRSGERGHRYYLLEDIENFLA
jgi:excisionase family DNA binding protein